MTRELVKLSKDRFVLKERKEKEKVYLEKEFSKEELKNTYATLRGQTDQLRHAIKSAKTNLAAYPHDDPEPEVQKVLDAINEAQKYIQKEKLEQEIEQQQADLDLFLTQMKEISTAVPEVLRKG